MSFSWGVSNPTSSLRRRSERRQVIVRRFQLHVPYVHRVAEAGDLLRVRRAHQRRDPDLPEVRQNASGIPDLQVLRPSGFQLPDRIRSGQDEAYDSCSMSYSKLEWTYKPQKADGSLDARSRLQVRPEDNEAEVT